MKYLFIAILLLFLFPNYAFANAENLNNLETHKNIFEKVKDNIIEVFTPENEPRVEGFTSNRGNHRTKLTKVVYGFFPYWTSEDAYLDYEALSHIAYFSLIAKTNGDLDRRYWPKEKLMANAKANDVKFLITITNFNPSELDTILGNETVRNKLIDNIVAEVNKYSLDGVSIDFETPNPSQASNMNTFLKRLREQLRASNPKSEVFVATWPVDWPPDNYAYKEMADNSDGFFIMAYNYHWSSSNQAGPVTTFDGTSKWGQYTLKWTIDDYLKVKTDNKKDKIIMGLPYYGLDWPVNGTGVPATTTGDAKAYNYSGSKDMAIKYGRKWEPDSKNPYVVYSDGTTTRQLWYDDAESLSYKYQLALDKDIQGIGIWALGFDAGNMELWKVIKDYFSIPVADTNSDRKVDKTDLSKVTDNLNKTDVTDADINEDKIINSLDASFVLTQWGEYPLPPRK